MLQITNFKYKVYKYRYAFNSDKQICKTLVKGKLSQTLSTQIYKSWSSVQQFLEDQFFSHNL